MARIIRFSPEPHEDVQLLLPWYLTGQLDEAETAQVERHLADCPECRAEFAEEQRLAAVIASAPIVSEGSWAELRRKIAMPSPVDRLLAATRSGWQALVGGGWRWVLASQAVAAVAIIALVLPPRAGPEPAYHTLGSPASAPAAADTIVVFQPDAHAEDVARALRTSGARLVDGPTEADAYLLTTPANERGKTLTKLRADPAVLLAEPLAAMGSR